MTFTIVKIGKNPKKKTAKKVRAGKKRKRAAKAGKRKVIRIRKNPEDLSSAEYQAGYVAGRSRQPMSANPYNFLTRRGRNWESGWQSGLSGKGAMRRNPVRRKKAQCGIVGHGPKARRYYFTGEGFSRDKSEAKRYAGQGAKREARRIIKRLPASISHITVESV